MPLELSIPLLLHQQVTAYVLFAAQAHSQHLPRTLLHLVLFLLNAQLQRHHALPVNSMRLHHLQHLMLSARLVVLDFTSRPQQLSYPLQL